MVWHPGSSFCLLLTWVRVDERCRRLQLEMCPSNNITVTQLLHAMLPKITKQECSISPLLLYATLIFVLCLSDTFRQIILLRKCTRLCLGGGLALLDLQADAAVDVGPLGRPAWSLNNKFILFWALDNVRPAATPMTSHGQHPSRPVAINNRACLTNSND